MPKGSPGACKICEWEGSAFLNRKYAADTEGFNAAKAAAFAKTLDPEFTFNRQTWYAHVTHITHPIVSAVKKASQNPIVVPKTNTGVLEAIRDLGIRRAVENPEEVTVDHALRAASELNRKQSGTDNVLIVFAKVLSGEVQAEAIVGEWSEAPALTTQEEQIQHG